MNRLVKGVSRTVISLVCVVGALSLFGVWRSSGAWFQQVTAWLTGAGALPVVDVRSVMVNQIRGANELATAVFVMEAVVPTKRDRLVGNFTLGTTTLLYIAYGEVRAGVDLSQIEPEDIQDQGDRLEITLPPAQILDAKIDINRSSVYDYDRGFLGLGPDTAPELQTLAGQAALEKIITTACQGNILSQANDRAKLAVGQLLSSVADKTIQINLQPVDPSRCVLPVTAPPPDQPHGLVTP